MAESQLRRISMENLKPVFTVNGKDYEIKRTRALLVEFQKLSKQNKLAEEDANNYLEIQNTFNELQEELELVGEKIKIAREEYLDDPTNADKKAKFNALKQLYKETQEPLLNANSKEMDFLNKSTKILLDNYEKAIIFAISEQYNMSKSSAEELWGEFVDEVGTVEASQWIYAIGDTLFNQEANENDFLARKRVQQQQMLEARRQIRKKK